MEFNHNFKTWHKTHVGGLDLQRVVDERWVFDLVSKMFWFSRVLLRKIPSNKCKLAQTGIENRRRVVKQIQFLERGTVPGRSRRKNGTRYSQRIVDSEMSFVMDALWLTSFCRPGISGNVVATGQLAVIVDELNVTPDVVSCLVKGVLAGFWLDLQGPHVARVGRPLGVTCLLRLDEPAGSQRVSGVSYSSGQVVPSPLCCTRLVQFFLLECSCERGFSLRNAAACLLNARCRQVSEFLDTLCQFFWWRKVYEDALHAVPANVKCTIMSWFTVYDDDDGVCEV